MANPDPQETADRLRAYYDEEMAERADRPLGADRERLVDPFAALLRREGRQRVLEIGCGAARDGVRLAVAGAAYTGVDLSGSAVRLCRAAGLPAVQASATALPISSAGVDAAWSMSTLMHLPGDGLDRAVAELARVVRPGGVVELGVWGHDRTRDWVSPDGRYFRLRSDTDLRRALAPLGILETFDTWSPYADGGHYQWARVRR